MKDITPEQLAEQLTIEKAKRSAMRNASALQEIASEADEMATMRIKEVHQRAAHDALVAAYAAGYAACLQEIEEAEAKDDA